MKVLVIVLVLLGLAFAGVVVFGAVRHGNETQTADLSGGAPPIRDGKVDDDAMEEWEAPNVTQVMARLFSPLAPRIGLASPIKAAASAAFPTTRQAPPDDSGDKDKMRVARVERVSGAPMLVKYACDSHDDDKRQCPQTICICAPGLTYDEDLFDDCGDSWTKRRRAGDGKLRCRTDDDSATLVIYSEGGQISFTGLGGSGVVQVMAKSSQ